jgi:hypothetical protein
MVLKPGLNANANRGSAVVIKGSRTASKRPHTVSLSLTLGLQGPLSRDPISGRLSSICSSEG